MSEMSSTSVSAAAIFSAEESCGRLPKRKDIVDGWGPLYGASYIDGGKVICLLKQLSRSESNAWTLRRTKVELHVSPIKKCLGVEVLR